jgi:hypothetical protein
MMDISSPIPPHVETQITGNTDICGVKEVFKIYQDGFYNTIRRGALKG